MRAALICFTARGEVTMQAAAKALQKKGWETTSYVKRKAAIHQKKIYCEEEKYEIGSDTEEGTVTEANRENSTEKYVQETEENILEKTENNFLSVLKMAEYHIFMQDGNLCINSDFIYMHFNYILIK